MELPSLYVLSTWALPLVLAITLHEAAHGWMAEKFGDPTARNLGRVTFNPVKHVDGVGTILLPGLLWLTHAPVLFGYAKPVPVDFGQVRPKRIGMFFVAFAGPGMNLLLAVAASLLMRFTAPVSPEDAGWTDYNLLHALIANCVLAAFNMIPILPLDGGRVLRAMLPGKIGYLYARTERIGMLVILALLLIPAWLGIDVVMQSLGVAAGWLVEIILAATGNLRYPALPEL